MTIDFKPQTQQKTEVEYNTLQMYSHTKSVIPTSNNEICFPKHCFRTLARLRYHSDLETVRITPPPKDVSTCQSGHPVS